MKEETLPDFGKLTQSLPYEATSVLEAMANDLEDHAIGFVLGVGRTQARQFFEALAKEMRGRGLEAPLERWMEALAESQDYEVVEAPEPAFNREQRRANAAIARQGRRGR